MRVLWTEGLFLSPHHFQQRDLHATREGWAVASALAGGAWGLQELSLDEAELAAGRVLVRTLVAVLPDGTWIDAPRSDAPPPRRELPNASRVRVSVAVPGLRDRDANVAPGPEAEFDRRYVAQVAEVPDLHAAAAPVSVEHGTLRTRLLLDREGSEDLVRLRLCDLVRDVTGAWRVAEDYVPPCLRLAAAPNLRRVVDEVHGMLVARRKLALEERRLAGNTLEVTRNEVANLHLLRGLDVGIASLGHVLQAASLPPERAYAALVATAASFTSLHEDRSPLDLPPFQPEEPYPSFHALRELIRALVSVQSKVPFERLALERRGPGLWGVRAAPPLDLSAYELYLAVAGLAESAVPVDRAAAMLTVSAPEDLAFLQETHTTGLALTLVPRPPAGVPTRSDTSYLRVRARGNWWVSVLRARELVLHHPPGAEVRAAELLLLPSTGG